jgi:hypothetical protein
MRNPFKSQSRLTTQDSNNAVEAKAVIDTLLPPPYMQRERLHPSTHTSPPPPYIQPDRLNPSTDTSCVKAQTIKRCLIWRMAVDWGLKHDVPEAQKPTPAEYSSFGRCCVSYCRLLGNHYESHTLHAMKTYLNEFVFKPGENLGVAASKLCLKSIFSTFTLCNILVFPNAFIFCKQLRNGSY